MKEKSLGYRFVHESPVYMIAISVGRGNMAAVSISLLWLLRGNRTGVEINQSINQSKAW